VSYSFFRWPKNDADKENFESQEFLQTVSGFKKVEIIAREVILV